MEFEKIIKEARRKAGFTQTEMADMLKVPVGTLRNWEQGRRLPYNIELIKEVIRLKVDNLIEEEQ